MITYRGACHCGNVTFEFESEITSALHCNCTFCVRRGALLHGVPPEQFRLTGGATGSIGEVAVYGSGIFQHHFCSNCGIQCFTRRNGQGRFGPQVRVNLRCVEGIDLEALSVRHFDGAAMPDDSHTWA